MSPKPCPLPPAIDKFYSEWLPRLEKHMWIDRWIPSLGRGGFALEFRGLLKPQPNEGGGKAVRRMFMDVLDQALDELADLGAVHTRHPGIYITGEALRPLGKPDDFAYMQCEVNFYLAMRH